MSEAERNIQLALPSPKKLFTPAVTAIIVLMIVGFTLFSYTGRFAVNYLALSAPNVLHGRIWQLFTYPLVNGNGWRLVFNGILVLFIGSSIEREWRTADFLVLWLVVSVTCGLLWVIVSLVTRNNFIGLGTGACGYGLIGAFGLLFRRRRILALFWTVEAQYLAWFLIVVGIILGIPQPITWIWVSGAAVAYVYIKLRWRQVSGGARSTRSPSQDRGGGFVDID
jgi:membrane associated rhomboid family serine protease